MPMPFLSASVVPFLILFSESGRISESIISYFCSMKSTAFFVCVLLLSIAKPTIAQPIRDFYESSLSLYNSGNTDQALANINQYLANEPNSEKGIYLRAFIYLEEGEKDKALADYTHLLKLNPNHTGALTNRALLLMEKEKYKDALKDLNRRVSLDDSDWKALFDRGYCKGLSGDNKGAIIDFTKVIGLNPRYPEAYANRGYSKINELTNGGVIRPAPSQTEDACSDLQKALSMGDSTVTKMINLYCKE